MRAMVLRGGQKLAVEELARPAPKPGWVLVKVRACGICGSDLHMARYADERMAAARASGRAAAFPMDLDRGVVMGHEWVAEIVEVGPEVEGWEPGDRVTMVPPHDHLPGLPRSGEGGPGYSADYPGGYGQYMIVRGDRLLRVPDHVPDLVAATTEPCAVGLHAVREARLASDEHVLVMGAGPIGMMTLLWLKHDGVRHVTVSDYSAQRRELAARHGADLVLDPAVDDVAARVAEAAGGPPAVVFECVGVEGTIQQAMELVAPRGRVVVVGVCMTPDQMTPMLAIVKHLTLQFLYAYTAAEVEETLAALADGRVDTSALVTRTVSLDDLPGAFRALSDPADCKVMVEFA
jgi:2-desacetyl-2-hydroxyethyl bacteriochlorophyllide A dehydrogenase